MSFLGKERLREGEEISLRDKGEIEREVDQQTRELMRQGVGPGDAFAAAIENTRRGRDFDFS